MRTFLLVSSVVLSVACSSIAETANDACQVSEREAIQMAKKLFSEHRGAAILSRYDVKVSVRDGSRIVRFLPKELVELGDHPSVVIHCETKTARFAEGQ
jgi:hypothetical protein